MRWGNAYTRLLAVVATLVLGFTGAVGFGAARAVADDGSDIYSLVNQERWSQGLSGLQRNGDLDRVAAAWASQMAASGTLSHNPQTSSQIPGGWSSWGENIAQGQPTGSAMHTAWMNSSGHRANILGNYTDIGIAFLSAGGTTWGVEVFATYSGRTGVAAPQAAAPPVAAPAPPAPAPAAPAPAAPEAAPEATPSPSATPTGTPTPTPTPTATPTPAPAATLGSRGKVRPTAGARPTQHAAPSPAATADASSAAAADDEAPQPVAVAAVASSAGLLGLLAIALLVPAARRILLLLVRSKPRRH